MMVRVWWQDELVEMSPALVEEAYGRVVDMSDFCELYSLSLCYAEDGVLELFPDGPYEG